MKIKLLIVQLEAVAGDIDKNISKIEELLNKSGHFCADLIVLPELWTIGWDSPNFNKSSELLIESVVIGVRGEILLYFAPDVVFYFA